VSWVTFLFNFNPLIKLDGYYLLSDWLDIPNLRTKAFRYLGNLLRRRLLGWPIEPVEVSARERKIFPVYGVLAVIYSGFLILYFVYLLFGYVGEHLGSAGILLLVVALVIILRDRFTATVRGVAQHVIYMKKLLHQPVKLTIYIVLLILVVVFGFIVPIPNRVSGEIIVQPISEFLVSMSGEGLLNLTLRRGGENPEKRANVLKIVSTDFGAFDLTPIVREGQVVAAGETLAVVASNQVTKDIASNLAELNRLEGNLALLKAPKKIEEIQAAQADVAAAQANFDQLTRELTRTEGLALRNLVATEKVEADRSAVAVAKAELNNKKSALALVKSPPRPEEITVMERDIEKQKTQIEYLKGQAEAQVVVTPIAGTVVFGRRADALLSIIDNSTIELEVPVSDFDIKLVAVGQTASIKLYPFPDTSFTGQVVRVPRFTVDAPKGNRFPVAVLTNNPDGLLRQGMTGFAKVTVGETSVANFLFRRLLSMIRVRMWSWW
jgi:putative peptide zinc metalloprotease protein